ncbi:MAG TPA: hypothetical protein VMT23_00955 [Candidatus Binatia bacterium]|nr:hypothetical protein [Candidatus Binatia bacterium]
MAITELEPPGESDSARLKVFKEVTDGKPDIYHFSVGSELLPLTMTRESANDSDLDYTYHLRLNDEELGEADIYDGGLVTYIDCLAPTGEGLKSSLLPACLGLLAEAIRQDFPSSAAVEDWLGNRL